MFLVFVEERAPVRIGVPDPIVAIEVQRASDAAIVRIAKQNNATEATIRSSTIKNDAKVQKIFYNNVKELLNIIKIIIILTKLTSKLAKACIMRLSAGALRASVPCAPRLP